MSEQPQFTPVTSGELKKMAEAIEEVSGARFLMVHFNYVKALKGDGSAAILLAYYLNEFRMRNSSAAGRKELAESGAWFLSPSVAIKEKLGMSYGKIKRCVEVLAECGVVSKCYWRGNAIWVKINNEALPNLQPKAKKETTTAESEPEKPETDTGSLSETQNLENAESRFTETDNLDSRKPRNSTISLNKKSKNPSNTPASAAPTAGARVGVGLFSQDKGSVDSTRHPRSTILYEALHRIGRTPDPAKVRHWEKYFTRKVEGLVGVGYTRAQAEEWVDSLLDTYVALKLRRRPDDKYRYLPAIECGRSFFDKFDVLVRELGKVKELPDDPRDGPSVVITDLGNNRERAVLTLPRREDDE